MHEPCPSSAPPVKVMLVYGTRPEAVKLAPLVQALAADSRFTPVVVVTGQHREMLDQVNSFFGIAPDCDLDVHRPGQTLTDVTTQVLTGVGEQVIAHSPDVVVVQGDTTSAFAGALAAFYHQVPVAHVEAGLRSGTIASPFPEEANRRLIGQVASINLCPTASSRDNLLKEGFDPQSLVVTGNTVIDALLETVSRPVSITDPVLERLVHDPGRQVVLVTAHRRESWGEPMRQVGRAVAQLASGRPGTTFVLPAHRNPIVREALLPQVQDLPNVIVTEPLEYAQFCTVMNRSDLVLTDSGGVQEEAPALSKPVLVMRENTERPEAVEAGVAQLVGTDEARIVRAVSTLLDDQEAYRSMAHAMNPYGDGQACDRILAALAAAFGRGQRLPDFSFTTQPKEEQQ